MADKLVKFEYFHWGPFLYRTKLSKEEIDKIKSLCKKDKRKDRRKKLAGLLKEEYGIDKNKLFPIIFPYLQSYHKGYLDYTGKILGKKINLKTSWVNFMKKNEFNPLHDHDGDLSFVIFVQIPEALVEENKQTITSGTKPGSISFIINFQSLYSISCRNFFPEEGDFFIFPANLTHFVNPFKSDVERISVSGNIKVN